MSALEQLGLIDVRKRFKRTAWTIGRRPGRATGATLHFAGDVPVPNGLTVDRRAEGPAAVAAQREQLIGFIQRAYVPRHIYELGADGIQYPLIATASGEILLSRDIDSILWHCANATGNKWSIGVHAPVGGRQDVTPIQWQRITDIFGALILDFGMQGRAAVRGHCEWPRSDGKRQKSCPGPILMARLLAWRGGPSLPRMYRVTQDANIRQGQSRRFPIALGGTAVARRGQTFLVDDIDIGEMIGKENRWAHRADGLGFIHMSLLEPV